MPVIPSAPKAPRGKSGLLADSGKALYGVHYHVPLATLLGVATKTLRRWLQHVSPIPDRVWADLDAEFDKAEKKALSLRLRLREVQS